MTKENAEKFMALYSQHKALAKKLAELDTKSEDSLVAGLVKMAKEMGLECTKEEISEVQGSSSANLEDLAGGGGWWFSYMNGEKGWGCI